MSLFFFCFYIGFEMFCDWVSVILISSSSSHPHLSSSSSFWSDGGASEASEVSNANQASAAGSDGADQANHVAGGVQGGRAAPPLLNTPPIQPLSPIRKQHHQRVSSHAQTLTDRTKIPTLVRVLTFCLLESWEWMLFFALRLLVCLCRTTARAAASDLVALTSEHASIIILTANHAHLSSILSLQLQYRLLLLLHH